MRRVGGRGRPSSVASPTMIVGPDGVQFVSLGQVVRADLGKGPGEPVSPLPRVLTEPPGRRGLRRRWA